MRDGRTVRRSVAGDRDAEFETWAATLVVTQGPDAGNEHPVGAPRILVGRGPAVDLALVDDGISQQHLALEFTGEGFRVVDLGSTNGTRVNGRDVQSQDLKHGDRVALGGHELQLVLEKREGGAPVYVLPDA